MEIRLNKLALRDFQGGTINLNLDGQDISVLARNAGGKTRLVSGFSWLLFGKDALGRTDFEIKNLDAQGEAAHGLEHTVEAELDVDGEIIILKKIYKEKWTKKRGNVNREFSGHTTECFIDGVPLAEKDYVARISAIAGDESRFRLVTSPTAFPGLHWQKQRQILLDVCGDLTDADVIASDSKLESLAGILGKHTLEDHRKIVMARRSEINQETSKIPIRIDEVRRGMPETTGIVRATSEQEVLHFENSLSDAKLRLQGINTGGQIAALTTKLSGLKADLRKMEDAHRSGTLSTLNRLNQRISEVTAHISTAKNRIKAMEGEIDFKEKQVQRIEPNLVSLREKWGTIEAETFQDSTPNTCAACGQGLPEGLVQAARDKALAHFNESKAERLREIIDKGAGLKGQKELLSGEIATLRLEVQTLTETLAKNEEELNQVTQDRDTLKRSSEEFSDIPGRKKILDEIEEIEGQINAERDNRQDTSGLETEISTFQLALSASKAKVDALARREQGEKRIEELKSDEKRLSAEYEKLEGELYLIDQFIRTKVSLLTTRINAKFETVRFRLFEEQVNGVLAECCQITVGGVPFDKGLNNGARINAGLEIVKVLQQHYGLRAPVFADNAEAVNTLVEIGCQMIRLYVSNDDKLRIEFTEGRSPGGLLYIAHTSSELVDQNKDAPEVESESNGNVVRRNL